ncbi:hypothetical protein [Streptomyces antibioticus]|uniref:hypothetical protein n=1 Tax=Streptomyces antibioticus TaxID=1890 RepID=UPI0036DE7F98
MDPVTITAGCGVAASLLRLGHLWLGARACRRRMKLEERHAQDQHRLLMEMVSHLPPGTEISRQLPTGELLTIRVPFSEAA